MADSSPYNTQTLQLQFLANIRVGKVVQRNPFTSAGRAFARRALIAVKGLPYVSNAAAVAEAGASHSGIYEKGKKENPDNPFNSKTVFDMSREVVVKGLGLATGTLGKRGTTFSIANNLYDAHEAGVGTMKKGESPLNIESFVSFAKAQLDGFSGISNFGILGQVLDTEMGIENIIKNRETLQNKFVDLHNLVLQAELPEEIPDQHFYLVKSLQLIAFL